MDSFLLFNKEEEKTIFYVFDDLKDVTTLMTSETYIMDLQALA